MKYRLLSTLFAVGLLLIIGNGLARAGVGENKASALWTDGAATSTSLSFLPYEVGSNEGATVVDGKLTNDDALGLPFSRDIVEDTFAKQQTPVMSWVKDDGQHLYITLDINGGKVSELAQRIASVYIKQPDGIREYTLHPKTPSLGVCGEFKTPKGKRTHFVFEFKIPLRDLRTSKDGSLELAFTTASNASQNG
jgi:hypothetical protein